MALLDTLASTTAIAAYSLGRRLRSAYAGNAFTVRRSSDNTTQNIGYVSDAVDVASLLAFCAGTDGFLTTIFDNTANGYNLTQATNSLQPKIVSAGALLNPLGSFPSAAGGGSIMSAPVTLPASNTLMNVLATTRLTSSGGNLRLASFVATGQSVDYNNAPSWVLLTPSTNSFSVFRNSVQLSTQAIALNTPVVVAGRWDGSNATSYVNGAAGTPQGSSGTFGTTGSLNFQHDGWGAVEGWPGQTSEMIVAAVMSSGDLAAALSDMSLAVAPRTTPTPAPPAFRRLLPILRAEVDPDFDVPSLLQSVRVHARGTIQNQSTAHAQFSQALGEAVAANPNVPVEVVQVIVEVISLLAKPATPPRMWAIRMAWDDYEPQNEPRHPRWFNRRFVLADAPIPPPPPPSSGAAFVVVMA